MPTNKTKTDTSATPGHVASTDQLGTSMQRLHFAGRDLAKAAEAYMDAVDDAAMKRALLSGVTGDHRALAWDQLQQAEEVETDLRRGLQRAVYYWRKHGA